MNFFYNLFKSNNNENIQLIDTENNNNENICLSINNNIKKREYDLDLIGYDKIDKHNYSLTLSENNKHIHDIINSTNYFYKTNTDYYIEFIKDIYLINDNAKLVLFIKNEYNKLIYSIEFKYKINHDYDYINDSVKIYSSNNNSIHMYLKKNDLNKFYIYKFIFKSNS